METHPEALCHFSVLPGQQGREKKMSVSRKTQSSSLTSLAESTEPKTMGLKAKAKTVRSPLLVSDYFICDKQHYIVEGFFMCVNNNNLNRALTCISDTAGWGHVSRDRQWLYGL